MHPPTYSHIAFSPQISKPSDFQLSTSILQALSITKSAGNAPDVTKPPTIVLNITHYPPPFNPPKITVPPSSPNIANSSLTPPNRMQPPNRMVTKVTTPGTVSCYELVPCPFRQALPPPCTPLAWHQLRRRAGTLGYSPELAILLFYQQGIPPLFRERIPARAARETGV